MMRSSMFALAAVCAGMLLAGCSATTAAVEKAPPPLSSAQPPGLSAQEMFEELTRVLPVDGPAGEAIEAAEGFAGLKVSGSTFTLSWRGPLPGSVRELIGRAGPGVSVVVVPANFTASQLRAAMDALESQLPDWKIDGAEMQLITPRSDGAGIDVSYTTDSEVASDALSATLSELAGVPVFATEGDPIEEL